MILTELLFQLLYCVYNISYLIFLITLSCQINYEILYKCVSIYMSTSRPIINLPEPSCSSKVWKQFTSRYKLQNNVHIGIVLQSNTEKTYYNKKLSSIIFNVYFTLPFKTIHVTELADGEGVGVFIQWRHSRTTEWHSQSSQKFVVPHLYRN